MRLFEIAQDYAEIIDDLYDADGNENPQALARLEANQLNLEAKSIAIASWIKNMEIEKAQITECKKQIDDAKKNMIEREKSLEAKINRWNGALKHEMETRGMTEIKCPYFVLKIKKNPPALDVVDDNAIDEEYRVYDWKLDRSRMLSDLKVGVIIAGASMSQKTRLEIK